MATGLRPQAQAVYCHKWMEGGRGERREGGGEGGRGEGGIGIIDRIVTYVHTCTYSIRTYNT